MDSLRTKTDIDLVFKKGRRIENEFLRLFFIYTPKNTNRVAVIIPRTAQKSAVLRNLLRRRTKEFLRKFFDPQKKGFEMVFFFKKEAFKHNRKVFYEELEKTTKRIF